MRWLLLTLWAGCAGPPVDTDGVVDVVIDNDADGSPADLDCDDEDPSVHPLAVEVCDGRDQDCDGVIDDGVPNDGHGCVDPGAPNSSDRAQTVQIVVRTGEGTFNGTDDGVRACLSEDLCYSLNKPAWNDMERGLVDVVTYEDVDIARSAVDRFSLEVLGGDDQWRPTCAAALLDGEVVYCRDDLGVKFGVEDGEVMSWTDELAVSCSGCFDAGVTHGPLVGEVGSDHMHLWWRTDSTRHVQLRVASSAQGLVDGAVVHHAWPSAAREHSHSVRIGGLSAHSTWWYDLELDGRRFGPYRVELPPQTGDSTKLRFAFGSCTKSDDQPIFEHVLAADPDLFLFVGDNHYANSSDLSALRQFYRHARARPLRHELLHGRSILATWDDHDYVGNNTDGSSPGRDVALRAFQEFWANGSYGTAQTAGVFGETWWGDVHFVWLDDRYWRGLDGTLLGHAQTTWLLDALQARPASFHVVISGSQFTQQGSEDSWAAFPQSWSALQEQLVARRIEGVVLLSGDIHRSEFRLLSGADGGYSLPELTSSPLATWTSSCRRPEEQVGPCVDDGPSFVVVDVNSTVSDPVLTARIVDANGKTRNEWQILRSSLELP